MISRVFRLQIISIVGAEALLRWAAPRKGTRRPESRNLIPIFAEGDGPHRADGAWVLETAARQQKIWLDSGYPISVSENLSPRQFRNQGLLPLVCQITAKTGCDPALMEFELTELMIMGNDDKVASCCRSSVTGLSAFRSMISELAIPI